MPQFVPIYYAPDIDNAWSVAPGALSDLQGFAPLQGGAYGSVGTANYLGGAPTITGDDIYSAHMLRQIGGTVRFFVARATNIDEYDASGTRTNRATGLTSSTAGWNMCAQGNAIVACNISNATQVSTGAGFAALGGGSPKAVHCASNFGFVMLANTDTNQDQVWWSAIYNYASFTPSIATEAGNVRLLEAPGPITALVAYRDGFVAFKDNALFVGEYVGPNYIWRWRCLSHRVGCVGGKAVAELDGKLYFLHTSGFYEFDGQNLRNVGLPVNQSFLTTYGYITGSVTQITADQTHDTLANVQAAADDVEGVVWFQAGVGTNTISGSLLWGYNPRCGKWGKHRSATIADNTPTNRWPRLVMASTADIQSFWANAGTRILMVWNVQGSASNVRAIKYIAASSDGDAATITTGMFGSNDGSGHLKRMDFRTLPVSSGAITLTNPTSVVGYAYESSNSQTANAIPAYNSELNSADATISSRYIYGQYTWSTGIALILAGISPVFESQRR